MRPWVSAEAMLENWSTRVRGKRSEITPPHRSSTIIGIVCAASTCLSAAAESVMSRTAKVSAMVAIIVPRVLTKREAKYQRKLRSRSGANEPTLLTRPGPARSPGTTH